MSIENILSLDLFKDNAELQQRVCRLLQTIRVNHD